MESTFRFGLSLLVKVGCTRRINIKRLYVTRGRGGGSVQRIKSKSALAASDPFRCGCFDALHPPARPFIFFHGSPPPPPTIFTSSSSPTSPTLFLVFVFVWRRVENFAGNKRAKGFCQGSIANRVTPSSPSSQIPQSLLLLSESRLRLMMWAPSRVTPFLFLTFSFARSLPPSPPSRKKIRDMRKKKEVV